MQYRVSTFTWVAETQVSARVCGASVSESEKTGSCEYTSSERGKEDGVCSRENACREIGLRLVLWRSKGGLRLECELGGRL